MFDKAKKWISENIISGKKEGTSAAVFREALDKVMEDVEEKTLDISVGLMGSITPDQTTSQLNSLADGVYRTSIDNANYNLSNALVIVPGQSARFLPSGYVAQLKKEGNNWSVASVVKMPMQDLTMIEQKVNNNEKKVDDFIRDFAVEVDQQFNSTSEDAQSGKGIFTEFQNKVPINDPIETNLLGQLLAGRINSVNTVVTDEARKYVRNITVPLGNSMIRVNMSTTIGVVPSDVYVPILGIRENGSIVRLLEASLPDVNNVYEINVTGFKYISVSGKNITDVRIINYPEGGNYREGIFSSNIKNTTQRTIDSNLLSKNEIDVLNSKDYFSSLKVGRVNNENVVQTDATRKYVKDILISKDCKFQKLVVRMSVFVGTANVYAPVLGIKSDGTIVKLLNEDLTNDVILDYEIDISSYSSISVSGKNIEILKINEYDTTADSDGKIVEKIKSLSNNSSSNFSDLFTKASPISSDKQTLTLKTLKLIQAKLKFPTIARGRDTAIGANNALTINLIDDSFTHSSVLHMPGGWNGYEYWCALTPYWGKTYDYDDVSQFENPHIFCSEDGINWEEPIGIVNPIARPTEDTVKGKYWSDTHLTLGDDGYLYCFFRGYNLALRTINETTGTHARAVGYMRSLDGVNWEPFKLIYSSDTATSANINLLSPCFINQDGFWHVFDVLQNISKTSTSGNNQYNNNFISHRRSKTLDKGNELSNYDSKFLVNFVEPLATTALYSWHIDACKFGNTWFILNNYSTKIENSGIKGLFIQYSTDGRNFRNVKLPIFNTGCYRSSLVPKSYTDDSITFWVYKNNVTTGIIDLYEVVLNIDED